MQQDILNKYISLGGSLYKIVKANNGNALCVSLYNEKTNMYIRVHRSKIVESLGRNQTNAFMRDSSFVYIKTENDLLLKSTKKPKCYVYKKKFITDGLGYGISRFRKTKFKIITTQKTFFDNKISESKHGILHEFILVSIIICNRNGYNLLNILFASLKNSIFFSNFEIICIDNNSNDKSIEFLEQMQKFFNIKIIKNIENESFSVACNKGACIASGKYLLFLNNDIEVTDYWLDAMLDVAYCHNDDLGAVGAKLIYPKIDDNYENSCKSFKIQHAGISFKYVTHNNKSWIKPYNRNNGMDVFMFGFKEVACRIHAVTGACLLIKKSVFFEVNGFDENYIYGYEDVDLCLKLLFKGYKNYYCPNSILYHYEFGTQNNDDQRYVMMRRSKNHSYYYLKWNNFIASHLNDYIEGMVVNSDYKMVTSLGNSKARGYSGIENKIKEQMTELGKIGPVVFYNPKIIINSEYDKTLSKFNMQNFKLEKCEYIQNIKYIYIRKPGYFNREFINFLKYIKTMNRTLIILMEIPTYPYTQEYTDMSYIFINKLDKNYTPFLKNYIDRIVTYSKDDVIYDIKTIRISNGIRCSPMLTCNTRFTRNKIIMIACAHFTYWHGYDRLIKGIYDYLKLYDTPDIVLYMIGDGPALEEYKKLVIDLKLQKHIIFHGPMSGDKLNLIYNECDIGIDSLGRYRSGVYYNSSLKSKEYCAHGLFVVSGVENELDHDKDFRYYFRVPNDDTIIDVKSICDFYFSLVQSSSEKKYAIDRIKNYAKENFDFSVTFRPVIDFIRKSTQS